VLPLLPIVFLGKFGSVFLIENNLLIFDDSIANGEYCES
jgi:hypothetical protein